MTTILHRQVDAGTKRAANFLMTLATRDTPVAWAACWAGAPFLLNVASPTYSVIIPAAARLYFHALSWGAFYPILAAAYELRYITTREARGAWLTRHCAMGAHVLRALVCTYFARADAIERRPACPPMVTCHVPLGALGLDDPATMTVHDEADDAMASVPPSVIGCVLQGRHETCRPGGCSANPCVIVRVRAWAVALHVALFDWPPEALTGMANVASRYHVFHDKPTIS